MAATVPIVGNSRENPSVYLRPIAQAISHRPATSRKSQAMGESSLKCLLISVPLHALCHSCSAFRVRKTVQRKIMNLKRKQPISDEGEFTIFLQRKRSTRTVGIAKNVLGLSGRVSRVHRGK